MKIGFFAALYSTILWLPLSSVSAASGGTGHLVQQDRGTGPRVNRPAFAIQRAPWEVSWNFDCSRVPAGRRHTVLTVSDAGSLRAEVISNGRDEGVVSTEEVAGSSNRNRQLRDTWHAGTSGGITIDETGQLYFITISTRCTWEVRVIELPVRDPLAGTWRYLQTVSRRTAEALGVRFQAVRDRTSISRANAIQLVRRYRRGAGPVEETLLARVDAPSNGTLDGCICWSLVLRPRPPAIADIAFIDARTGNRRGEITLST